LPRAFRVAASISGQPTSSGLVLQTVQNSGILDITNGPIATESYSGEIEGVTANESADALVQAAFFKPPPPGGVGMQCAATDQFSYAEVKVTADTHMSSL